MRGSYGGALRVGYVLGNGALLYGRVGVVQTRFNTIYEKGNGTGAWIDQSDTLGGTRIGVGAEIPASESAFVRMDYSFTRYGDSISFVTTNGVGSGTPNPDDMTFKNYESLFRLGFGFRF
jgi:opacity protein-like surface antigen